MANVLFRLREYDDAFRDLFGRAMRAHAEEASGRAYGEDTMRNILKYSGSISEAMGNAVDGRGKRFGWPVIIEVLEGVEFDFDERGEPEFPTMISDRDLSNVVP